MSAAVVRGDDGACLRTTGTLTRGLLPYLRPPGDERALEQEQPSLLDRWQRFIESMLVDLRIDAEVHPIAVPDFAWQPTVYRDTWT